MMRLRLTTLLDDQIWVATGKRPSSEAIDDVAGDIEAIERASPAEVAAAVTSVVKGLGKKVDADSVLKQTVGVLLLSTRNP